MFLIHHVQGSFFLRRHGINREFVKFWCVKPNLDWQKALYYHTNRFKSMIGSHQLSISRFLIHHVQGSFLLRKCRKNGWFAKFWCVSPILTSKTHNNTTPLNPSLLKAHFHAIQVRGFPLKLGEGHKWGSPESSPPAHCARLAGTLLGSGTLPWSQCPPIYRHLQMTWLLDFNSPWNTSSKQRHLRQ